jgi:para-aminobenzoate synthetase component 1
MTGIHPYAGPGLPEGCRDRRREFARLEWRRQDGGDPAARLEQFCDEVGLRTGDLSRPGRHDRSAALCGVAILVSAAAGAQMIGGAAGALSPAPAVPDLVAVAYRHEVAQPIRPDVTVSRPGPWRSSWQPDQHAEAVASVIEAIGRGDVYQVNVVGHQCAPHTWGAAVVPVGVPALPGAGYGAVLAGDGWAVASASPECLAEVADGSVITRPIKGTRAATATGRRELLASVKERAEHVMIVDLERNDLAHVAVPGSIEVSDLFAVREWCGLWQAESTVSARLRRGTGLAALLRALCPPGSVTGTPKLAALDHIAALEPVGRGPAMGALGYVTAERLSLGLTIRTVAVDVEHVHVWAGGGITWRSEPMDEVAEAAAKAAPVRAALTDS